MNNTTILLLSRIYYYNRYLEKGKLFDEIIKRKFMTEEDIAYIGKQLLSATAYYHSKGIVHRILIPENILVESINSMGKINIKIKDITASLFTTIGTKTQEIPTNLYYSAPELFKGHYNEKCDVWSIGAILYTLLSGYPPINGKTCEDLTNNAIKDDYNFSGKINNNKRKNLGEYIR